MKKSNKFSAEACREYPSLRAAVEWIASKIGGFAQTLPGLVKQSKVDCRRALGHDDRQRTALKELESELTELRRASEIPKLATAFSPRRSSTAD